jgi:hypothetical protein
LGSLIVMHHWHHHITPNRMTGSDSEISPARHSFIHYQPLTIFLSSIFSWAPRATRDSKMAPRRPHQIVLLVQRRYGLDHDGEHASGVVRNAVSHVCERVWIPLYVCCASMPEKDGPSPERPRVRERRGERKKDMRDMRGGLDVSYYWTTPRDVIGHRTFLSRN